MKKLFYSLFVLGIISCSTSSDDMLENQQIPTDLEPNKAFAYYMESPKLSSLQPSWYYTFNYENGRLVKMTGKFVKSESIWLPDSFYSDPFTTLSYHNNQIELKFSNDTYPTIVYTIENDKPKKAELYNQFNELITVKNYTYEIGKIKIYSKTYTLETYYTYYLDSNNNLIKSEKLEKSGGLDKTLTTTTYSNFDNSKNPFKKLYLLNDNFYEKSLSNNNYRKINYTIQNLENPQYLPGNGNAEWAYQYDLNGQIVLYHQL
ncbi:hypothetical protein OF897_14035 [Chryseobacterium formosus]|uniref:YD repeat-containing protein n=1 Tax=Chryseobacterium formosus TaxID=1537363 RepID=A0ABT3XSC7_9FLAO|nr:hypothetical protein [Chryseobacterium formosus]MCX8525034.1 hypothetical protein [Chryseobacterium formosus]